ncbi:putative glycolipid-binding domain-containing protein [Devosia sp.]|uniref:putative glycolipid-binding domain-containing protein n=1 Tax=Devosia sp. TaxID=1871048 RepID=UPI003265F886
MILSARWKSPDSIEHCHINRRESDTRIRGAIIGPDYGLFYRLKLNDIGNVRDLVLERTDGRSLELYSDGAGNWSDDRAEPLPDLRGCIDIDLSASPLTNSLPIWRTELLIDTPQRFRMAWIDVATLAVQPDQQIYTKLDSTHLRYQSADGSFERIIEVDENDLVVNYPGLFERG